MKEKISTQQVYESDKEWLRKLRIKHNFVGLRDVIRGIRKMITKHKMEDELK